MITNRVGLEQTPRSAASDLGLHYLFKPACLNMVNMIYSQLLLSRSPRDSEILQDIRSPTYQICRIEEKIKSINFDS